MIRKELYSESGLHNKQSFSVLASLPDLCIPFRNLNLVVSHFLPPNNTGVGIIIILPLQLLGIM